MNTFSFSFKQPQVYSSRMPKTNFETSMGWMIGKRLEGKQNSEQEKVITVYPTGNRKLQYNTCILHFRALL